MTAKTFFIAILLFAQIGFVSGQDNVDTEEMVGFACYFGGQPSKTVKKVTKKLKNRRYKAIKSMLTSDNNAERYMAVIALEKLHDLKAIKLYDIDYENIDVIKNSNELVSICSGCSSFYKTELHRLFEPDMKNFASNWLNYNFKDFKK
ncbi:hypothetical protein KEM09_10655 [Carboxylicivirga mesophila]|uniref:DUF4476 domain-containing protein n=1 Tax=Carboxylicivirga mesophila TaxID=1166478 RepID=A0ABS5KBJ5_9BACT|nr:hypothetical protein [Carboxylicivirga mesophila]MBS2211868.1 hypothetical protein [Carboxylicivirga mesophila]